jgi:restriction system protein
MPRRSPLETFFLSAHDFFLTTPAWLAPTLATIAFLTLRFLAPLLLPTPQTPFDHLFAVRIMLSVATWAIPALLLAAWVTAEFSKFLDRRRFNRTTSIADVQQHSWQQFERLVAEAFRRQGYHAEVTGSSGPDGGIDILLHKDGQLSLVQCKHWKAFAVGVKPVRELRGLVAAHAAARGVLVTSGRFTPAAHAFAADNPIDLIDGEKLARLLPMTPSPLTTNPLPPPQPSTASPPLCAKCHAAMQLRTAHRGPNPGSQFWGCTNFPKCRFTRPT